jgi:hypothetical protein
LNLSSVWFAHEVYEVLRLKNTSKAVSTLDDDEKISITISDGIPGNPNKTIVNEPELKPRSNCLFLTMSSSVSLWIRLYKQPEKAGQDSQGVRIVNVGLDVVEEIPRILGIGGIHVSIYVSGKLSF